MGHCGGELHDTGPRPRSSFRSCRVQSRNRAAAGNIYLILGNGTFDTSLDASGFPSLGDCGNCYV